MRRALWASLAIAVALTIAARTQGLEPRVAGFNELVIIDPGVHPQGLPAVKFKPGAEPGKLEIDIPPTLHVHRYYYSGNKEFQGPILTGGPTTVVANNPWNGERMYVDVMLPPGAPVVVHNKNHITYVYPDRRVCISFPVVCREKAIVTYHSGRGVERQIHEKAEVVKEKTREHLQQSKLVGTMKRCCHETKEVTTGAAMLVGGTANVALDTMTKLARMVPGYEALRSLGKQHKERGAAEAVRQADQQNDAKALQFVKTNQ